MADQSGSEIQFRSHLSRLPRDRDQLLPALLELQRVCGYLPSSMLSEVASHLRIPVSDVESVANGYPELHRHERAPHVIRVCAGAACTCAESRRLHALFQEHANGRVGISIEYVPCLFVCAMAPAIEIDGRTVGRVSLDLATNLLDDVIGNRDGTP